MLYCAQATVCHMHFVVTEVYHLNAFLKQSNVCYYIAELDIRHVCVKQKGNIQFYMGTLPGLPTVHVH